jgi:hypothetical protein
MSHHANDAFMHKNARVHAHRTIRFTDNDIAEIEAACPGSKAAMRGKCAA